MRELESRRGRAFERLARMYRVERTFPDLSHFRLGPNAFERIPLDWLILSGGAQASAPDELIGHGIAARLAWDGDPRTLPAGWQRTVRKVYENVAVDHRPATTLVGLFIKVEDASREQGWAGRIVESMKTLAARNGLTSVVIPLRLPTAYERGNAAIPYEEFAYQRRDDGQFRDHWLRLHTRLGARVIGHSLTSHQHAFSVEDFHRFFEAEPALASGDCLAQRSGEWYRAHVDLERDCVVINEGCVWVQHPVTAC